MINVLYVDDEQALLDITKVFLERIGDFSIRTALSASAAMKILAGTSVDCIVADYQMPEMDGIAFLQALRAQGDSTPFIVFTGKGREEVVIQALNSGADFYLQKGGDPKAQFAELAHKIRRAVQERTSRKMMDEIVEASPIPKFVINHDHQVVFWNRALEEYSGIAADDIIGTRDHWKAFYESPRPCLADLIVDNNIDGITRWYSGKQEKPSRVTGAYEATDFFPRIKGGTWLFFTAAPLHDNAGRIIGAIETLQDITSMRKKEDEVRIAYQKTKSALELARESEQRYHNVVEYQNEFICRFSPDGTHIFVNKAYCRYFKKPCDEIIGHRFLPDIFPGDRRRLREHFASLTHKNPVATIEHRIIMPDGEVRWQQWSDRAIFDENGNLKEYQSVGRDVTDHKRAEEQLQALYTLSLAMTSVSTIQEVLPLSLTTAIQLSGMDAGGIYFVNENTGDLELAFSIGLSEEFIRETSLIRADSDSARIVLSRKPVYSQHLKLGIPLTGARSMEKLRAIAVIPIISRNRVLGCFNIGSHVRDYFPDESRSILEAVAAQIGNGIIRLRAEDALRESEKKYRELTSLLPQTVYELDCTGRITFVNQFGLKQFGYTREELDSGLNVLQMIHPGDHERALHNISRILEGQTISSLEYRARKKDGSTFPVIIYGDRVFRNNQVVGLRGIVVDISEQKKGEDALRESEQKYRTLVEHANEGIIVAQGNYLKFANAKMAEILGYSTSELLSRPFIDFIVEEDRELIVSRYQGRIQGIDLPPVYDFRIINKSGSVRWLEIRPVVITWEGSPATLNFISDFTERKQMIDAVKERELQLNNFMQNLPVGIFRTTPGASGRRVMANPILAGMHGYDSFEEFMQVPVADLYANPEEREKVSDRMLQDGRLSNVTIRFKKKNGELFWGRLSAVAVPAADGSIEFFDGVIEDITEQKKAEEALLESEERYRLFLQNANDAVFVHEMTETGPGRYIEVNSKACELTGYSQEELLRISPSDLDTTEQRERSPEIAKEILVARHAIFQTDMILKTGTTIPVEISANIIDLNGKPTCLSFVRDITSRKQAEIALLESEEHYRTLFQTMIQGVVYQDSEGKITGANPAAEHILGLSLDQMQGRTSSDPCWRTIHEDGSEFPGSEHPSMVALRTGKTVGGIIMGVFNQMNDTYRWILIDARPQFLPGDMKPSGVYTTFTDITDRKKIEDALSQVNKKLNILASVTRHDILNKLTALTGYHELVKQREEKKELVELLEKEDAIIEAIIRQIDFTREYERLGVARPQWQRVYEVVASTVSQFELGKIKVTNAVPGLEILADIMLEKVFYNLTDNAIRYGEKITEIRVSCKKSGDDLIIAFDDNGVGIAEGEKEKIFERGYGRHSGLGLYLALEILDITGIAITETGRPGKGARFEIRVPNGMYKLS